MPATSRLQRVHMLYVTIYAVVHAIFSSLFQVALADDVGKSVEELLGYLGITVKVDPSGSLLCVQQVRAYNATICLKCTYIL